MPPHAMRRIYTMGPLKTGKKCRKVIVFVNKRGYCPFLRLNQRKSTDPFQLPKSLVIFHTVRNAAEGGMVDARRTGRYVVINTTSHPARKSMIVLAHGNENAAPSSSQMAL